MKPDTTERGGIYNSAPNFLCLVFIHLACADGINHSADIELKSIPIMIGLVWSFLRHTDIIGLFSGKFGQLCVELLQLQTGNLLVQVLRQGVNADRVFAGITLGPQFDLGNGLVGEGGTHHIRRMTRAAT